MKSLSALGSVLLLSTATHAAGTVDGLDIHTTKPGPYCSRKSKNGDKLHMNYRGTLQSDGSEFDSSIGRTPFVFTLGAGQVIKGWDLGLVDMCIGESRRLTIQPSLGYGSSDMDVIPPNSVLSMSFMAPCFLCEANEAV
jgi:FKBP-type peptidyl-prolyl cis-trans isomerase